MAHKDHSDVFQRTLGNEAENESSSWGQKTPDILNAEYQNI